MCICSFALTHVPICSFALTHHVQITSICIPHVTICSLSYTHDPILNYTHLKHVTSTTTLPAWCVHIKHLIPTTTLAANCNQCFPSFLPTFLPWPAIPVEAAYGVCKRSFFANSGLVYFYGIAPFLFTLIGSPLSCSL